MMRKVETEAYGHHASTRPPPASTYQAIKVPNRCTAVPRPAGEIRRLPRPAVAFLGCGKAARVAIWTRAWWPWF